MRIWPKCRSGKAALPQAAYETPEHKEAVAAFLEKRPADFRKLTG